MNDAALTNLNESVAALNAHHERLQAPRISSDERKLCMLLSKVNALMIEGICRKEARGEDVRCLGRSPLGPQRDARSAGAPLTARIHTVLGRLANIGETLPPRGVAGPRKGRELLQKSAVAVSCQSQPVSSKMGLCGGLFSIVAPFIAVSLYRCGSVLTTRTLVCFVTFALIAVIR
jgi:hypothetical protein